MWGVCAWAIAWALSAQAGAPQPAPPTGFGASPADGSARLTWQCVAGHTYVVYASEDGDTFDIVTDAPPSACTYTVGGLANGKRYHFYVAAVALGVEGPGSNRLFVTPGAAPKPPAEPPRAATALPAPPRADKPRGRPGDAHSGARPHAREWGRLGLMLDAGWNGMVGVGAVLALHAHPLLTLEGGSGYSRVGWKWGARARFNVLRSGFSPYLAAGYVFGDFYSGILKDTDASGNAIEYEVGASHFVQAVLGAEWILAGGWTCKAEAGWAVLYIPNLTEVSGKPSGDQQSAIAFSYGSGFVLAIGVGYTFGG